MPCRRVPSGLRGGSSVEVLALQLHLRVKLEVVLLSIRAYGVVDLKLLIVFIELELAAGASFNLDRGDQFCTFVLGDLAVGERRQGRYGEYSY